jgi:hypothetical protein
MDRQQQWRQKIWSGIKMIVCSSSFRYSLLHFVGVVATESITGICRVSPSVDQFISAKFSQHSNSSIRKVKLIGLNLVKAVNGDYEPQVDRRVIGVEASMVRVLNR